MCSHTNAVYRNHKLECPDCSEADPRATLPEHSYPANFIEVHVHENGSSVVKVNNHIDQKTFYRVHDKDIEHLGDFDDLNQATDIAAKGTPLEA